MTEKPAPERPQPSKRQKAIASAFALLAIAMMGVWQYAKYVNGHGLFRLFDHGGMVLAACIAVAVLVVAVLALRDR